MIECRYCDRMFSTAPEKIGARCPKCRMPLFEPPVRRRTEEQDLGACADHPESTAVAQCQRCSKLICTVCRTRWNDKPTCPACIEMAVNIGEPTQREVERQAHHAWASLVLAAVAWLLLLATAMPAATLHTGNADQHRTTFTVFFFFSSMIPAAFALGQGFTSMSLRGGTHTIAASGLCGAAAHIGIVLGILLINIWHN